MRKILLGIFISFGIFFLMSHNASAAGLSYNLNDYSWKTSVNLGTQYCAYAYDSFGTSPSICILTTSRTKAYGLISYALAHKKNDLAEFYVGVSSNYNGSNTYGNLGLYMDNFGTIDDNFKIISVENVSDTTGELNEITGSWSCTWVNNGEICQYSEANSQELYYARIYKLTILWTTDGSHPIGLRSLNANTPIFTCKFSPNVGAGAQCQIRLFGYTQWEYSGSSVNKEQKEEANQAISDSESSSEENSSNSKTTNLIGALSGIFTTISSTSATNCNITGDLGSINMGALNLCQGKEHFNSLIEFIGFTSLFVVVFWASYHLVRRTLGLIDWARSN